LPESTLATIKRDSEPKYSSIERREDEGMSLKMEIIQTAMEQDKILREGG
jgi:hypothetical protein